MFYELIYLFILNKKKLNIGYIGNEELEAKFIANLTAILRFLLWL